MSVTKFLQNPAVRLSLAGPPHAFNKGHTSQYTGVVLIFLAFVFLALQRHWELR